MEISSRSFLRSGRILLLSAVLAVSALGPLPAAAGPAVRSAIALDQVIPAPAEVRQDPGIVFELRPRTSIFVSPSGSARQVGDYLAGLLRPATGYALPVRIARTAVTGAVNLQLAGADAVVGAQGYTLDVSASTLTVRARTADGLFAGVQTLRQLLPAKVENTTAQPGPWAVQGGRILDRPRYGYRGVMLDVARHYYDLTDIYSYLDEIARYKVNYLHLHLTDDQGWRIAIDGWPRLTEIGGSTGEGDVLGGYYTQADYRAIVAYAARLHLTVIPEIEGPAHSQAALASYGSLNCDGTPAELFTDIGSGDDGVLCIDKPITYRFLDDVIGQIAALTPGPYVAIGTDETQDIPPAELSRYLARAAAIVARHGKKLYAWQEALSVTKNPPATLGQYWIDGVNNDDVVAAARRGSKIIMSPATHAYIDMKYNADWPRWPVGNAWAGYIEVRDAYGWSPDTELPGLPAGSVAGVEATLFGDTVFGLDQMEELTFPRLPALAEVAWSPPAKQDWTSFSARLAQQGPRWALLGIDYYPSTQIAWPAT